MSVGFGRRAAAGGQRQHMEDPDLAVKWQGKNAPGFDLVARFGRAAAVDADVPGFNHRLGQCSALRQPDEEQKLVDPQISAAA